MRFQLHDGGLDFHVFREIDETRIVKVAQADRSRFPGFAGFFHGAVSAVIIAEGLVDEKQVDVIGPQPSERFVNAARRFFVAGVGNPDFRGDEKLFAGNAAFADGVPDAFFVVVRLRRVDGAVARLQRFRYEAFALFRFDLPDAVADHGHFDAVVQSDVLFHHLVLHFVIAWFLSA